METIKLERGEGIRLEADGFYLTIYYEGNFVAVENTPDDITVYPIKYDINIQT